MSDKQLPVAVVGPRGSVGEALLAVLAEREFPVAKLYAVGRDGEDDETVLFAERPVLLDALDDFDFSQCRLAFFCVPAAVAKKHVPRALKAGCRVIDTSRQFRLDKDVPLLVAGVNETQPGAAPPALIASPGAPAVQLATLLHPLAEAFGLRSVDATTLLAVSARGRAGVNELAGQTARLLNAQSFAAKTFPLQIAFNLIPAFDAPHESGYTHDERRDAAELAKLLGSQSIEIAHNAVFAPVFYGHSQIVNVRTQRPAAIEAVRAALAAATGIELIEPADEVATPVGIGSGTDKVAVGRICQGADSRSFTFWTVADNVRKGAAVNAVEIAAALLKSHL